MGSGVHFRPREKPALDRKAGNSITNLDHIGEGRLKRGCPP